MPGEVTVYFNPACGTARSTLALLEERGVPHTVVEYLKQPPSRQQLEHIVDSIDDEPGELVRKDKRFGELGLDADDYRTRDTVVDLLLEHPELMQRPVVFVGERASICRPSDKVLALLEG
jgi:arsenate reductase